MRVEEVRYDITYFIEILHGPSTMVRLHGQLDRKHIQSVSMFPKGLPDEGRPTPSVGVPHGWGDKGMKGGWIPRKAGTGWFVQILLEWCQQDDDPETECIYYVQHKEADLLLCGGGGGSVSVGRSLWFRP